MVKRCAWGTCKSDTRYPDRVVGVVFYPFPKPKSKLLKCREWIRLCGRPHQQLNENTVTRDTYVCSKHFVNGHPDEEFQNPMLAVDEASKPYRPPANKRRKCIRTTNYSTEIIPSKDTVPACEDLNPAKKKGPEKEIQNKSEEERSRMKVRSRAEEFEHLTKQLSDPQYGSVTPEFINTSETANYFEYCTGFKFDQFKDLCTFLRVPTDSIIPQTVIPLTYKKETWHTINMPLRNQFLLVLMKLRKNYDMNELAVKFQIDVQSVRLIFNAWVDYLYQRLGQIPIWPHRDVISANTPDSFKKDLPTTFAILDYAELKIERPSSSMHQHQSYSGYKSTNVLKGLIACDPSGSIIFVSTLHIGPISDRDIFKQSNITTLLSCLIEAGYLNQGDILMGDKGFDIEEDVEDIGLYFNMPHFAKAKAHKAKLIAKHRVCVERAIAKI